MRPRRERKKEMIINAGMIIKVELMVSAQWSLEGQW